MRKIAVINSGDRKHAHEVERDCEDNGEWAPADPDRAQAAEMERSEGDHAHPVDLVGLLEKFISALGTVVSVDPLDECRGDATKAGGWFGHR